MHTINVIGSGVVGQATGKDFLRLGHKVIFCDTNQQTVEDLKKQGYEAILPKDIGKHDTDIFFLTTPTPTTNKRVQLTFLKSAVKNIAQKYLKKRNNQPLIVVKSTVPPGTTEHVVSHLLEHYSGKVNGKDFHIAMNPEYLREKTALEDVQNPPMILIGASDKKSEKVLRDIYEPYKNKCPIKVLTPTEAEMQKYIHNLWNATKISFFNEMREVSEALELNTDSIFEITTESAEASWNRKYGIKDFGPFGGACLPKDTQGFLDWTKKTLNMEMGLLKSVIEVNENLIKKTSKNEKLKPVFSHPHHFSFASLKFAKAIAPKNISEQKRK